MALIYLRQRRLCLNHKNCITAAANMNTGAVLQQKNCAAAPIGEGLPAPCVIICSSRKIVLKLMPKSNPRPPPKRMYRTFLPRESARLWALIPT